MAPAKCRVHGSCAASSAGDSTRWTSANSHHGSPPPVESSSTSEPVAVELRSASLAASRPRSSSASTPMLPRWPSRPVVPRAPSKGRSPEPPVFGRGRGGATGRPSRTSRRGPAPVPLGFAAAGRARDRRRRGRRHRRAPRAHGLVRAFVSITDRDARPSGIRPLTAAEQDAIARRWAAHGLTLTCFDPASAAAIDATGSSWGRRLTAGVRRGADRPARPPTARSGPRAPGRFGPTKTPGLKSADRALVIDPPAAPPRRLPPGRPRPRLVRVRCRAGRRGACHRPGNRDPRRRRRDPVPSRPGPDRRLRRAGHLRPVRRGEHADDAQHLRPERPDRRDPAPAPGPRPQPVRPDARGVRTQGCERARLDGGSQRAGAGRTGSSA